MEGSWIQQNGMKALSLAPAFIHDIAGRHRRGDHFAEPWRTGKAVKKGAMAIEAKFPGIQCVQFREYNRSAHEGIEHSPIGHP